MKAILLIPIFFGLGMAAAEEQYQQTQVNNNGSSIYDLYKQQAETYNVHKQHRETDKNNQQNVKVEVKVEK